MLNDPNSTFKYKPSFATDIRRTFARVKRELAQQAKATEPTPIPTPAPAADPTHVVPMRPRSAR